MSPTTLYKFGKKKRLDSFLDHGEVSFAIATTYLDSNLTEGQQDNENQRLFKPNPKDHNLKVGEHCIQNLIQLDISLDFVGVDGEPLKYYMWCSSFSSSPKLLNEFNADSCVKINNPEIFAQRLIKEANRRFPSGGVGKPGCDVYGRNVIYWDTNNLPPTADQRELIFLKELKYENQEEFRIIFVTNPIHDIPPRFEFKIGSLHDIAEYCIT